jgi:hypothetical protein
MAALMAMVVANAVLATLRCNGGGDGCGAFATMAAAERQQQ